MRPLASEPSPFAPGPSPSHPENAANTGAAVPSTPERPSKTAGPCLAIRQDGSLSKAALTAVQSAGLGRFLGTVNLEPAKKAAKGFAGWRIVEWPKSPQAIACRSRIPIPDGAVVTRVNGRPIGRPAQAFAVWQKMADLPALRIDFRTADGQPGEAIWPIR